VSGTVGARPSEAADLVRFFAVGWAVGATDSERFFTHFGGRLAPDALLEQPIAQAERGPEGLRALFAPLFAAIPDLTGEVLRWGETMDGVLIEARLGGTVGGRPLEWITVDRIVLRDGLIAGRRASFDPLPVVAGLLRRPRTALKLLPRLILRRIR
jgi:hypothetical protein